MQRTISEVSLTSETKLLDIDYFIMLCSALHLNVSKIRANALATIKYLNSDEQKRRSLRYDRSLEQRWYRSLAENKPDYAIYDTEDYLAELYACWIVYSKRYLAGICAERSLEPAGVLNDINRADVVVDLGCGIAFSTAMLKMMFPYASVYGTNLEGLQTKLGRKVAVRYNFEIVADPYTVARHANVVFASEYFEHFYEPVAHLREVLAALDPDVLLIANTFTRQSAGHFDRYLIDNVLYDGATASRLFNRELRRSNYVKVKTNLWNSRPAYWKKLS